MLRDNFLLSLQEKCFKDFDRADTGNRFTAKKWDFVNKAGLIEVNVLRGSVFEKACVSTISATVTIPDRSHTSTIQWLGIQTFPVHPSVPMLMAVFEHVDERGLEHHPGFFDVYPIVPFDEDRQMLAENIGGVCRSYSRPYPDLPEGYVKMFRTPDAGIGVGYGVGMALQPDETDHGLFKDISQAVLSAYFEIVDKRKDAGPDPEGQEAMKKFRTDWAKFTFMDNRFFQGGIMLGVPPESFMLHMLPPTVCF